MRAQCPNRHGAGASSEVDRSSLRCPSRACAFTSRRRKLRARPSAPELPTLELVAEEDGEAVIEETGEGVDSVLTVSELPPLLLSESVSQADHWASGWATSVTGSTLRIGD